MSDLAAFWCSVLACDRACASWSIPLTLRDAERGPMAVAYRAFVSAKDRHPEWTRAAQWAEAEAMLRSGRYYYRGGWRRWT